MKQILRRTSGLPRIDTSAFYGGTTLMGLQSAIRQLSPEFDDQSATMPELFVGHGNPMNAIEDNEFSRAWAEAGRSLPRPKAILCISAHWETEGTLVTAMEEPVTIHDFSGFPEALYNVQYPAKGEPALARLVQGIVKKAAVRPDGAWGLDHGAWSVLSRMFPAADVPVIQLSLDRRQEPEFHYELGKELSALRRKGVLIVGSGNMVHNLRLMRWQDAAFDWAVDFDNALKQSILARDHEALIHYRTLGPGADLSVPTREHYLPLLYVLAGQREGERVSFFTDRVTLGSLSMRSLWIG